MLDAHREGLILGSSLLRRQESMTLLLSGVDAAVEVAKYYELYRGYAAVS